MRTTLTLDDEIARVARALAHERNTTMGRVISDLAKKGLQGGTVRYTPKDRENLPVFQVREDSPPITLSDVKRAEDEA